MTDVGVLDVPAATVEVRDEFTVVDIVALAALTSLCVGHYPMLLFRSYTSALAVLAVLAPLGLYGLVRLARQRTRDGSAATVLVGWIVVAGLLSGAPMLALKGTVGRDASGLIMIMVVCAWALGRQMSGRGREIAPYLVLSLLTVNGLVGVVQVLLDVETGSMAMQFGRAVGFAPSSVYFGALMAGGALLAASLDRIRVPLRLGLVAFFGAAANLSGTRIASLAGLLALVAFVVVRRHGQSVTRLAMLPAAFVVGTVLATVVSPLFSDVHSATTRGTTGGGERLQAWRYGLSAVAERPIAGWGFGRFRAATQAHYSADFVRVSAFDDVRQAWFDAHNIVVNTAVSIGLVGLLIAVWWVWESRHVVSPALWFAIALALTWCAQPAGLATLPLVAILWGAGARSTAEPFEDRGAVAAAGSRRVELVMVAIGVVIASYIVVADTQLKRAIDSGDPRRVEQAAEWYPGDAVVADVVAQSWLIGGGEDPAATQHVIDWSVRATERESDRPYHWSRLGIRQAAAGDQDAAVASVEHAIELQPWHRQSWLALLLIGNRWQDDELIARASAALCELGEDLKACRTSNG